VVGVMRLSAPEDGCAEVAVVVRDDFQGRGVGRALLQRLPTLAQRMGVHTAIAAIDAGNLPALRLMRHLDYPVTAHTSHAQTELHILLAPLQSATHTDPV
jgi:L-amino acid N-acyltransferase YncA